MKYKNLILCLCALAFASCKKEKTEEKETPPPPPQPTVVRDSTLWGHLGEDTGMSTLQFITDGGDTLDVFRTSQYTGEDGRMLGEVRNYTDRFAITLGEGNETLVTAINVTQLARHWDTDDGRMDLKADGTVSCKGLPYNGWKLWNGHILLSSEQQQEYGKATRVDTMEIVVLDDDSLVIQDHIKRFLKLYNPI